MLIPVPSNSTWLSPASVCLVPQLQTVFSTINHIKSGVPQGSGLWSSTVPIIHSRHTNHTNNPHRHVCRRHSDNEHTLWPTTCCSQSARQEHLNLIQTWLQDWRIKVGETKSTQMICTLRRSDCPHVYLNNIEIARANVAKYLGMHLDSKMTWKVHIAKEKGGEEMDIKI